MGGNQRKKETFCLVAVVAFISRHLPECRCAPGALQVLELARETIRTTQSLQTNSISTEVSGSRN